jgi:ABC-type microcin C transport system permease subunit YejB
MFFIFIVIFAGCASNDGLEMQIKQLREELYSEIRTQKTDVRDSLRKEIKDSEGEMKKYIQDEQKNLQNQISEVKEMQKKYAFETDKSLIDHQRQIFQNKAVMEDTARRIYMIESVITSKSPIVPQQISEGFITFVENKKVALSLGSINGIKVGDQFGVFRDKEKIGTIEINTVERDSSQGLIIENSKGIFLGDRVEIEKK